MRGKEALQKKYTGLLGRFGRIFIHSDDIYFTIIQSIHSVRGIHGKGLLNESVAMA